MMEGKEMESREITIEKEIVGERIDAYLAGVLNMSRSSVVSMLENGEILVNGNVVKKNYKTVGGEILTVFEREIIALDTLPEDIPLDIVYEDDSLLVVNKPAGLVVHPGHGNYHGTLVNALAYHFKDNPDYDVNDPRMGLVHRIDKDTSGLLVVAKTPNAKTHLGKQFFDKTTKREYVAIVWGTPSPENGRIEGNIGRSLKDRLQMAVFPDGDMGKHAVTHYETIESFGYVSVVKCRLETGRTHQIRVHMKHIGHPLLNDARYGGDQILRGTTSAKYRQFVMNCFDICPRQALHARTLGFVHPETGEELFFSAPVPDDMTTMIEKWRVYVSVNR